MSERAADLQQPVSLVRQIVLSLNGSHRQLDQWFEALGLIGESDNGSKAERLDWAADQVTPERALGLLRQIRNLELADEELRFTIADLLDADTAAPRVDVRARRTMAQALDRNGGGWDRPDRLIPLVDRTLVPARLPDPELPEFLWSAAGRRGHQIEQHAVRNADWSAQDLFEQMGAFTVTDRRFIAFLQNLISHETISDEQALRQRASAVDSALDGSPLTFAEDGENEGYPAFTLRRRHGHHPPPSLILFATVGKPDLRLDQVMDRGVEVLNYDKVLAYNRPVNPGTGLRWKDLVAWWADIAPQPDPELARRDLYGRMALSIPESSPPQRELFRLYHEIHHAQFAVGEGVALLPETWVHWDPKTVRDRGDHAFATHRMDFLMLLPHGRRVVIEVDGAQHYSHLSDDGALRASPEVYSETVRGDRELRLDGYEVYRFGGWELADQRARRTVNHFFSRLLTR